jgi:hypothetical protein
MPSSNPEPVTTEAPEPVPAPLILLEPEEDAGGVCTPEGVCD